MGLYTSIYRTRKCNRCKRPNRCEYQIKTRADSCQTFEVGAKVPDGLPHGKFQAHYSRVCDDCEVILKELHEQIVKRTRDVIFRTIPKASIGYKHYSGSTVLLGNKRVCTFYGNGFASNDLSKEYKQLSVAVKEFWKAQLRSANITWELEIVEENNPKGFMAQFSDKYGLRLTEFGTSGRDAAVVIGNRFKIIEPHPLDKNDGLSLKGEKEE
jgi:hypothetical protein